MQVNDIIQNIYSKLNQGILRALDSDIISIFLNAEMINEIILSMHHIVLGKVIPLFKNLQKQLNLKLVKSIPYQNGLLQLYYEPGYY